ncbi:Gmad2 immunoglobulin-like domain-containing protein, partial [Kineococcus rubinsiae]|uniref:Gmad2 immunoglobulin-like domain-containing protein n=1 Tax=Kineococcus rubinsiae TaxID=2609562 RepID=UPI0014315CC9
AWTAVAAAAAVVVVGGGAGYALTRPGPGDTVRLTAASAAPSAAASTTPPASTAPAPAPSTADPTAAATSTAAAAPATSSPASTPAAPSALPSGAASVPVYWLGDGSGKLFREFVKAPGAGDDATRALRAMLAGAATDPDYTSPWSADDAARVTSVDGVLVVDLDGSVATGTLPAAQAAAAVQQLVHTVTAAAGEDLPVRIQVGAAAEPTLFGHAVAGTVSRAPQADVQAPAWITSTSTATPGQVVVQGVGTGFEGTLLCTVTDASGAEVARDAVQAGANGRFAEFTVTVPLPAGTYTIAVQAPDESGGEGSAPAADTKTVTVR